MPNYLTSSLGFAFLLEDTTGTYKTDVETTHTGVRIRELDVSVEVENDNDASTYLDGTIHGADESIKAKKTLSANYEVKVSPALYVPETSGGAGDAVHKLTYADLLRNAGMAYVVSGGAGTDLAPATHIFYHDMSQASKTMSIAKAVYDTESNTYQLTTGAGCMSNVTISADGTAMPFKMAFDTQGRVNDIIDQATGVDIDQAEAMRVSADKMSNTTITITDLSDDSVYSDICITSMTFETGNEIQQSECQVGDAGIKNMFISKIDPRITINPLLTTKTTFDWWTALSTEKRFSIAIESQYLKIFIPQAQINSNAISDSNGQQRNELNFRVLTNLDGDYPSWIPLADQPANPEKIPYYIGILEREAQY